MAFAPPTRGVVYTSSVRRMPSSMEDGYVCPGQHLSRDGLGLHGHLTEWNLEDSLRAEAREAALRCQSAIADRARFQALYEPLKAENEMLKAMLDKERALAAEAAAAAAQRIAALEAEVKGHKATAAVRRSVLGADKQAAGEPSGTVVEEELMDAHHTLERQLTEANREVQSQRTEMQKLCRERDLLRKQLEELQAKLEMAKEELMKELAEEARRNKALVDELRKQLKAAEAANRVLTEEYKRKLREEIERAVATYTARIQELEAQLAALAGKLEVSNEQPDLMSEVERLQRESATVAQKLKQAVDAQAAAEKELELLRHKLKGFTDHDALLHKVEHLLQQLRDLEMRLQEANADKLQAQLQVGELQKLLDDMNCRRNPWNLYEQATRPMSGHGRHR